MTIGAGTLITPAPATPSLRLWCSLMEVLGSMRSAPGAAAVGSRTPQVFALHLGAQRSEPVKIPGPRY
jgi:hypothetical protein